MTAQSLQLEVDLFTLVDFPNGFLLEESLESNEEENGVTDCNAASDSNTEILQIPATRFPEKLWNYVTQRGLWSGNEEFLLSQENIDEMLGLGVSASRGALLKALNSYGFSSCDSSKKGLKSSSWLYSHQQKLFNKDDPNLLKNMKRSKRTLKTQISTNDTVGKFALTDSNKLEAIQYLKDRLDSLKDMETYEYDAQMLKMCCYLISEVETSRKKQKTKGVEVNTMESLSISIEFFKKEGSNLVSIATSRRISKTESIEITYKVISGKIPIKIALYEVKNGKPKPLGDVDALKTTKKVILKPEDVSVRGFIAIAEEEEGTICIAKSFIVE